MEFTKAISENKSIDGIITHRLSSYDAHWFTWKRTRTHQRQHRPNSILFFQKWTTFWSKKLKIGFWQGFGTRLT